MANYLRSEFHLNKVFFGGNVGKDPVFKQAPNIDICEFPLCIPLRRVKPKTEREELKAQGTKAICDYSGALWLDIVIFGKVAKPVATRIKKGDRVIVVGRIDSSQWEDNNGVKHSRLKVVADDVTNIGGWQVERNKSQGRSGVMITGADGETPPPGSWDLENQIGGGQGNVILPPTRDSFRKKRDTVTFEPPPTKAQDELDLPDGTTTVF